MLCRVQVFIDCPPSLSISVGAAALFSDIVLAPLNPDKFSAKGLQILKNELKNLGTKFKKQINFKVFLNKFSSNTLLSEKAITTLLYNDAELDGHTLSTAIRNSQNIPNSLDINKSLFSGFKNLPIRDDFQSLTMELLEICPQLKK